MHPDETKLKRKSVVTLLDVDAYVFMLHVKIVSKHCEYKKKEHHR